MFHSLLWTRSTLYNETTNLDQHQATSVATQAEYKEQYHHSAICLPLLVLRTDLHGHICKPSRPSLPFQSRLLRNRCSRHQRVVRLPHRKQVDLSHSRIFQHPPCKNAKGLHCTGITLRR
jgi:hypothetical protein